jgi:hypothetical protein
MRRLEVKIVQSVEMNQKRNLSEVLLRSIGIMNFDVKFERAELGEILMLTRVEVR